MNYKYRWYYALAAGFLSGLIGYCYLLHPDFMLLTELQLKKLGHPPLPKVPGKPRGIYLNQLTNQSLSPPSSRGLSAGSSTHPPGFSATTSLATLAQEYGLTIKSMSQQLVAESIQNGNGIIVKFSAQGDFLQVWHLLTAVERQSFPVVVTDFSCKVDQGGALLIYMDIMVDKASVFHLPDFADLHFLDNPFCSPTFFTQYQNNLNEAQTISIELMQMQGYMHLGQRVSAFIQLPNKHIVLIEPGLVIGKENGMVMQITHDHILIKLPGEKSYTLKMS